MKRKTVTLCMIVRDEESTIGSTIKSVLALVDEIIIADTGSQDNTSIIAEGYGAKVIDVPWDDDFAAARNKTLDMASGDWILVLNADEVLQSIRPVDFQRLLHNPKAAAYRVDIITGSGEALSDGHDPVRLFRNHPVLRYTYPLRESLETGLREYTRAMAQTILDCPLVVVNEGQTPERLLRGRDRDQRILRQAGEAHPHEPYYAYLKGCKNLSLLDDDVLPTSGLKHALEDLGKGWQLVGKGGRMAAELPTWLPDLGLKLVSGSLALGRVEVARQLSSELLSLYPQHPGAILQAVAAELAHLQEIRPARGSLEFRQTSARVSSWLDRLRDLSAQEESDKMDNRRLALYPLRYQGELDLLEGRVSEAVEVFERALDLDPEYSFAWLGLAECCRFAGDRKRALKHYLRTVAACPENAQAWLAGCLLMRELDCPGNATTWWNRFCLQFPEHPAVVSILPQEDISCTSC